MAVALAGMNTCVVTEDGNVIIFGDSGYATTAENIKRLTFDENSNRDASANPTRVRQVAAAEKHTGFVTDAGNLFMYGDGRQGQLGLGDEDDRETPAMVDRTLFGSQAVLMVACYGTQSAVVTEGGDVYTFGKNWIGNWREDPPLTESNLTPKQVPPAAFNGEAIVMVAVGSDYIMALSKLGHVFTWGDGRAGKLGHGNYFNKNAPRQVESQRFMHESVVFVAASWRVSAAITESGRLYTWGDNGYGQLGHGDTRNRQVPTLVEAGSFRGSAVVMVSCSEDYMLVVKEDGTVWACGNNSFDKLGLIGRNETRVFEQLDSNFFGGQKVVVAAAGEWHSAAVTEDGALWTWGRHQCLCRRILSSIHTKIPGRVTAGHLDAMRVGQFHPSSEKKILAFYTKKIQEDTLAFYMSQNGRLGANSPAKNLKADLLDMITHMAIPDCKNYPLFRLLGLYRHVTLRRICKSCS